MQQAHATSAPRTAGVASVAGLEQVTCILPVKDMERARRFYEDGLGLAVLGEKPDGKFVYVTSEDEGTVTVVDPAAHKSLKTFKPATPRAN